MMLYNFNKIYNLNNIINIRVVPCENYLNIMENNLNKKKDILDELDILDKLDKLDEMEERKLINKTLSDINDGLNIISNFLDNKDLYNLSLIDKYHYQKIIKNERNKERLFEYKINKIPIYRSYIHKMGDERTNPIRYIWLKNNFTIEEKAKINNELILKCNSTDLPRYGEIRIIFSLYENGLICQLPSYSGMIKTNSNNPLHKEYTFILCFELKSFYFDNDLDIDLKNDNFNGDLLSNTDIYKKSYENKRYKKIYFINDDYEEISNKNLDNKKEYEYVLEKMLVNLNHMNENDKKKFDNLY